MSPQALFEQHGIQSKKPNPYGTMPAIWTNVSRRTVFYNQRWLNLKLVFKMEKEECKK